MYKLLLTLTIALTVLVGCTNNKTKSQQELKVGKNFYFKSKFDSSIVYFNSAVKLDTTNSEAYYFLSKANYQIDNYTEALKLVDIAEHKKYNSDSTINLKLDILFAQENYDDYISNCDKLIRRNSSDYKIYFEKSTALFNKADEAKTTEDKVTLLKEALDNVNISLNLNKKNAETFVLRGAIRWALTDNKGAINDFDFAINTEKKDSSMLSKAYRYKGLTEDDLGNFSLAETMLDSAIMFRGKSSILYLNRGDIKINLKKIESACDDFRKSLELGSNDAVDRIRQYCK